MEVNQMELSAAINASKSHQTRIAAKKAQQKQERKKDGKGHLKVRKSDVCIWYVQEHGVRKKT